jgi:hypothetical protein
MYPTHHYRQEYARQQYADMLREARMTKLDQILESELEPPFTWLRRLLSRRRPVVKARPQARPAIRPS